MSTYTVLRDRALGQVNLGGGTEAQAIAQTALEEAMKYVAFHVRIPSLISKATATAPANATLEASAISLTGGAGTFGISANTYQTPDRLYIKAASSTEGYGVPYEYLEYHHFIDLKSIPSASRVGILDPSTSDERPDFAWTITPAGAVWAYPVKENNVLTLFYRIAPAAYSGAATPEIQPLYDYILVNGAVIALKEYLREPDKITNLWSLFDDENDGIIKDVRRYDLAINGARKRSHLKVHRSYRTRK